MGDESKEVICGRSYCEYHAKVMLVALTLCELQEKGILTDVGYRPAEDGLTAEEFARELEAKRPEWVPSRSEMGEIIRRLEHRAGERIRLTLNGNHVCDGIIRTN